MGHWNSDNRNNRNDNHGRGNHRNDNGHGRNRSNHLPKKEVTWHSIEELGRELDLNLPFSTRILDSYFFIPEDLQEMQNETASAGKPHYVGIFLGKVKRDRFYPSLALIEMISKDSSKKITLKEKGSWLFMCGRDIMVRSVQEVPEGIHNGNLVFVQDMDGNNLGLGRFKGMTDNSEAIAIENILDRGSFLRRELS